MNINVGENMTTTVGMNKYDSIGMNNTESVGMMKMTSVIGDTSMFITGKLTEMIEGDVTSETKKERHIISEGKIISQSSGTHEHHSDKAVKNNSGEKGNNF